jgi:RHS repeat-associated protein
MILTAKNPKHANRKTTRVLPMRSRCNGWRVIQDRAEDNTPLVSYTRGTDFNRSLEGAGGIGGMLARSHNHSGGNWSTHNFYQADGNGNITYLVNSSQTLAARYRYDPYGNTISSSGTLANANTYRFSSKKVMPFDGGKVYYYGYRFYDANLQRWLNRDPIMEAGGINLYGFVGNSPVNSLDSFGLYGYILPDVRITWPNYRDLVQRYTFLGGRCCNRSGESQWALVGGSWRQLNDGECTGRTEDCDGMTCGGGFYAVYQRNAGCDTPGEDCKTMGQRRWTPEDQSPKAESPEDRGSNEGNFPPDYTYN